MAGDGYISPEWSNKDSALVAHLDVGEEKANGERPTGRAQLLAALSGRGPSMPSWTSGGIVVIFFRRSHRNDGYNLPRLNEYITSGSMV